MTVLLWMLGIGCVAMFLRYYRRMQRATYQEPSDQMHHDGFRELSKAFAALAIGAAVFFATIGNDSLVAMFALTVFWLATFICSAITWHYGVKLREVEKEESLDRWTARTRAVLKPLRDVDAILVFAGLKNWADSQRRLG